MAFKMKGFHMPGIAGVKAEVDKINKLSGKTQKVMKVEPKDEFSTIASRKKIYDSRVVAQGADQEDVDSEKAYEESQKTPLPMKGSPKSKDYLDDKTNSGPVNGKVISIGADGGEAKVDTPNGVQTMSGLGIAEIKKGMTVPLIQNGDSYSIDGPKIDKALTGGE